MGYKLVETNEQLRRLAAQLGGMPRGQDSVALDTETTGLDPREEGARLLLLQIGIPGQTWVVNACKCDLSILKPVLEDSRLCILQNAKFDYKWLRIQAGIRLPRVYDTMLAELLLIAGLFDNIRQRRSQANLRELAGKYCNVVLNKAVRKDFVGYQGEEFGPDLLEYAAEDIPHLFPIKEAQVPELQAAGLIETATIEFRAVPVVGDMELNGLGIDRERYAAVIEEARTARLFVEGGIQRILLRAGLLGNLFGEVDVKLRAPAQLKQVFQRLGIQAESTEEEALKAIDHPFARALLTWREFEKQVSTYGDPVLARIHPVTGRIHAEFLQLGSDAGRFSCEQPNIQQIPATPTFRSCFVAAPGNVMVVGDWSQFELRILAQFSRDRGMIEAFEAGLDLHTNTASRMFGIPYEKVPKKGKERQWAKILNFAIAYGMGPPSLAVSLRCSVEEAKEAMERWFSARPQAKAWLEQAARSAITKGESRTLAGRRRLFSPPERGPDRKRQLGAMERKGKNSPIQGSNADMLKDAMRRVSDKLRDAGIGQKLGTGLVACVHDEMVLEVEADRAEQAREILLTCMVEAGERYLTEVPVKAEVGIAPCWQK